MDALLSIFQWIGQNEAVLSGIAASIVIIGVLFTPLGRGVRALLRGSDDAAGEGGGGAAPTRAEPVSDRASIAVLPFQNLSGDPAHDFLADGLTEDVITGLSRIKQFFVIARNSTFTYKGRAVDVADVSRELGVRYVLEGSVRQVGDRVRVTAQLVDATTRGHTWAERFDRPLDEIFAVQDEVTGHIVSALQPALRGAEAEHSRLRPTDDLTAWSLVNGAWVEIQSDLANPDAWRRAAEACERALERDPDYAFAHAALGLARSLQSHHESGTLPDGRTLADAGLASARRALELAPDDSLVQHAYAALLGNLGRTADAVRAWKRCLALDPNSAGARAGLGIAQIFLIEPEEALANIDAARKLSPRDPITYHWLSHRALACAALGRWDEAREDAQDSVERRGTRIGWTVLAATLARDGRLDEARRAFEELRQRLPGLDLDALVRVARSIAPDEANADELEKAIRAAAGDGDVL